MEFFKDDIKIRFTSILRYDINYYTHMYRVNEDEFKESKSIKIYVIGIYLKFNDNINILNEFI